MVVSREKKGMAWHMMALNRSPPARLPVQDGVMLLTCAVVWYWYGTGLRSSAVRSRQRGVVCRGVFCLVWLPDSLDGSEFATCTWLVGVRTSRVCRALTREGSIRPSTPPGDRQAASRRPDLGPRWLASLRRRAALARGEGGAIALCVWQPHTQTQLQAWIGEQ